MILKRYLYNVNTSPIRIYVNPCKDFNCDKKYYLYIKETISNEFQYY